MAAAALPPQDSAAVVCIVRMQEEPARLALSVDGRFKTFRKTCIVKGNRGTYYFDFFVGRLFLFLSSFFVFFVFSGAGGGRCGRVGAKCTVLCAV